MDHDQVFRWILILGIATVLPIGLYHRIKSQASGEKLDRRQEGLFILATLRPIGALKMIGVIAWLIDPESMAWSSVGLPIGLRWIGVIIGAFAAVLIIWVFRTIGTNITDTVVTRKEHTLVTSGPYRYVRHPFYLAFGMATVADSLIAANWYLALTGGLAFLLILMRTKKEEGNLVARFGDDYRRYKKVTGMLFPRFTGNRKIV